MSDGTLPTLIRSSRNVIAVHRLRCPECANEVHLECGVLECMSCPGEFENLAALAVGEGLEGRDG